MRVTLQIALVLLVGLLASPALADDWKAAKLFGQVLQLVDGQWQPLARGDLVPDGNVVRTLALGRVTFTRGEETVNLGPNTQIQIFDEKAARPFTTVKQYFGTVSVEAEVENVQHFAVETPYLAAVVKGTRFTVNSDRQGASVSVQRGHVQVTDSADHSRVLISVGQSASVKAGKSHKGIAVSGSGDLPKVLAPSGKAVAEPAKSSGSVASSTGGKTVASSGSDDASAGASDDDASDDDNSGKGSGNSGGSNDNSGKGSSSSGSSNSGNGNSGKGSGHSGKGSSGSGSSGSGSSGNSGKGGGDDDDD